MDTKMLISIIVAVALVIGIVIANRVSAKK